jgi:hypothetical protein
MIPILAIDLGKFKSVYCAYDPAKPEAPGFGTVCTNVETLEKLVRDEQPQFIVFETCTIAGWVGELCQRHGVDFAIANPNAEAWRWKNVKRKTDRDDALKLARLAAGGELPVTPHVPAAVRQQRALLKYKQQVIGQRVRAQNHIRAMAEAQGRRLANGAKAWTKAGMQLLDEWSKPLAECGALELWRGELHQAVSRRAGTAAQRRARGRTRPQVGRISERECVDATVADDPRRWPQDRGGRGELPARPMAVPQRRRGVELRRAGAATVPIGPARSSGSDQQVRPRDIDDDVGPKVLSLNNEFNSANETMPSNPAKLPASAICRAAPMNPAQAARASADPTLTRRTPSSARSETRMPVFALTNTLTGFGLTDATMARMSSAVLAPGANSTSAPASAYA